jgi:hypothetical protein
METPFCLEILGVHIYYLDGVEMSNENGVLRKLLWLYLSFPYYAVSLALGARIIGDGFSELDIWVISLSVQAVFHLITGLEMSIHKPSKNRRCYPTMKMSSVFQPLR